MILQAPVVANMPWWDSPMFGSAVVALVVAIASWISSKKQDAMKAVADKTHILVNSQMGTQLRTNVVSAQALYEATKTPEAFQLLQDAKKFMADHDAKQAVVDAGK